MTSAEYAAMVAKTVNEAKSARELYEDERHLALCYEQLAEGSAKRCMGVGQMLYEVKPGTQRFELRPVSEAIIECRQEALDVPAYLTQVAHLLGEPTNPDVREGIHLAAQLLMVLDRLAERADG